MLAIKVGGYTIVTNDSGADVSIWPELGELHDVKPSPQKVEFGNGENIRCCPTGKVKATYRTYEKGRLCGNRDETHTVLWSPDVSRI